jgi:DNA-binding NarL/FixJ family response regulator
MSKPNIQIGDLVREMTDEEYETYLIGQEESKSLSDNATKRANSRQAALAKLAALGLTEEEIAAL